MRKFKRDPDTHKRPTAVLIAKQRDEYTCQWHLVVWGMLRPGVHGHHLFRPRNLYDDPKYIITLCEECHSGARHTTGSLTDQMLIEQVMIPYIWGGENLVPKGF
jgi:hypothetical protein